MRIATVAVYYNIGASGILRFICQLHNHLLGIQENDVDILMIISSIASLILAIIAIWLSLHHKKETNIVHQEIQSLLGDIKSEAKSISNYAAPELKRYGDAMRHYLIASSPPHGANIKKQTKEPKKSVKPFLEDALINHINNIKDRIGFVTPISLLIDIEDRINANDLLTLMVSLNKKGLLEWDSQPTTPKGDEKIRLIKNA